MRTLALVAIFAALAPTLVAQRVPSPVPPFAAPQPPGAGTGSPAVVRSGVRPGRIAYPLGIFADSFYSDALYSAGYPVASQPSIIILQSPPAATIPERTPPPAQPLMIELQGDTYVRVSGEDNSGAEMIDRPNLSALQVRRVDKATQPRMASQSPALPAVDLVFRDGHHEQVAGYTIADGVLYTGGDFYSGGPWNKKIELLALNIPETITSNRSRGINFQLPTAPNEVIVRP